MANKYKYLLFDNDGTLVDTMEVILTSFRRTMKTVLDQDNPDVDLYASTIGLPTEDQMKYITDDPDLIKILSCEYRKNSTALIDKLIKNYDGVPEALAQLKELGNNLGIVTSKNHELTVKGLKQLGIYEYFDYIQGSDDWHVHKPNPGAILHAVEVLGLSANEVLYIGDAPFDLVAGNGAGVDTCSVTWGAHSADKLTPNNPTYIIDSPDQLIDVATI